MTTKSKEKSKAINFARKLILKANHVLGNYSEVIWLLGDGRSGTTWVSELINYEKKYREIFEPFHPMLNRDAGFIVPHQYIRPYDLDEKLNGFASNLFSGKYNNQRVDYCSNYALLYNGILIKDIFANLLCYSVFLEFDEVKPILLIRNPFAVALSKYKKKNWLWATEPLDLLNQTALYEDFLYPFEDLIRETSGKGNYILNQILIWSIINYIPLRQFETGDIYVCFYENMYAQPSRETSNIFCYIKGKENYRIMLNEDIVNRPSRAIGTESNLLSGTSPIVSWKSELSHHVIDDGLKILQYFGFDDLYDDESMPNMDVFRRIHESA